MFRHTHALHVADATALLDARDACRDAWHVPCIGRASLANVREDDERDLLAALIDYHAPVERMHVVIDPMDVIG